MCIRDSRYTYSAIEAVDRSGLANTDILVFPNPSDGNIRLRLKGFKKEAVELAVTDAMGRLCISRSLTVQDNEEDILLNGGRQLAPGTYVLAISTKDNVYRRKITVN